MVMGDGGEMFGEEIAPFCLALSMFSAAGGFYAVAGSILRGGKGTRELGCVELCVGLMHIIALCFLLSINHGFEAIVVFFLGLPWFALGLKDFSNLPLSSPIGDWINTLTIAFLCGAVFSWIQLHKIVLGAQLLSYAGIGLLFTLLSNNKVNPKIFAYYILAVATALILAPGLAAWFSIPLP